MTKPETVQTYWKCGMHFEEFYRYEIKHGVVTRFNVQIVLEERCEDCNHCEHDGEDCEGHRYCTKCGYGPLVDGWSNLDPFNSMETRYRCDSRDCEPTEHEVERDMYFRTSWDESGFCQCPPTCKCRNLTLQMYPIYFDATIVHKINALGRGKYGALASINCELGRLKYDDLIQSIWGSTSSDQEPHQLLIEDEVIIDPEAGRVTPYAWVAKNIQAINDEEGR